jgi:hypothetical protein
MVPPFSPTEFSVKKSGKLSLEISTGCVPVAYFSLR